MRTPGSRGIPSIIDGYINSAFDTIKLVADNIPELVEIAKTVDLITLYLGASTSEPTKGYDSADLVDGNFYFNISTSLLGYYNTSTMSWTYLDITQYENILSQVQQISSDVNTAKEEVEQHLSDVETIKSDVEGIQSSIANTASEVESNVQLVDASVAAVGAAMDAHAIYKTTALGLAATLDTEYFSVPVNDTFSFLDLYENVANVAVFVKRYPSAEYVAYIYAKSATEALLRTTMVEFLLESTSEFEPAIVDSTETKIILGFDSQGRAILDLREEVLESAFLSLTVDAKLRLQKAVREYNDTPDIEDASGSSFEPAIVSEALTQLLLGFDQFGNAAINLHQDSIASLFNGFEFSKVGKVSRQQDLVFAVVDDSPVPKVLISCDDKGKWTLAGNQLDYGNLLTNRPIIYHLVNDGQSQALGWTAVPVLTTSSPAENFLMPLGGVRALDTEGVLESYRETSLETTCSGTALEFVRKMSDRIDFSKAKFKILFSAPGMPGTRIDQYISGGVHYERFYTQVTNGKLAADLLNHDYQLHGFTYSLGGTDMGSGTTKAQFKSRMNQLISERTSRCRTILNDPSLSMMCVSWQNGFRLGAQDVPMAQYEMHLERDDFFIAVPSYIFTYNDGVHVTNESSIWLGHYLGKAYKAVVIDGKEWDTVRPLSFNFDGVTGLLDIVFNVPTMPLEFDVGTLLPIENQGFRVYDGNSQIIPINSVSIVNGNTVRLDVGTENIPTQVSYGEVYTGNGNAASGNQPRGMLRDSEGYTDTVDINGTTYAMHNWCMAFKLTI